MKQLLLIFLLLSARPLFEIQPQPIADTVVVARRPWMMIASYYHQSLHLGLTASGVRYDSRRLTAAHPYLPFGTRLWLRANNRSVVVVVNDRGPFVPGRHLDLSRAAAQRLGMIRQGILEVDVEVL